MEKILYSFLFRTFVAKCRKSIAFRYKMYKRTKLFTSAQMRELDQYTIEHEPIASIDLMERAADALTEAIALRWDEDTPMVVFAGPGNNGGDALAVTRMLRQRGYDATAYLFNVSGRLSPDCQENLSRLKKEYPAAVREVTKEFDPPQLTAGTLVIDGLFGYGINKPLTGGFAAVVKYINQSEATVVSIDMPSGLMPEDNTFNVRANIVVADHTLTLGTRKLCMMMADNQHYLGEIQVLDIGLSEDYMRDTPTQCSIVTEDDIIPMLRPRHDFVHKGDMGHALLVAGSRGMAGAAILAARACLRSGVGKVTVHTPQCNSDIMQISVPEAIVQADRGDGMFSQATDANRYGAMGIGPGLGVAETTAIALMTQVRSAKVPVVVDADALNILASHRAWLQQLPAGIVFTPHPKEMDRLLDSAPADDYDRLMKACDMAQRLRIYILLKGHYSALCLPDGNIVFNSTGNAGMATAGSGDVLTGIVTALLARGYSQQEAATVGMYVHGLAGDLAMQETGMESLVAGDIIGHLPSAFKMLGM